MQSRGYPPAEIVYLRQGGLQMFVGNRTRRSSTRHGATVGRWIVVCLVVAAGVSCANGSSPALAASVGYDETHTQAIDIGNSLNAISCVPSTTTCVAADSNGDALYATDVSVASNATWTPWNGPNEQSPAEAVACPSITLCVLADGAVPGGGGNVYRASSLGGTFLTSFTPKNGVNAISCPTTSFCVATAEGEGFIRYSTKPSGASWTAEEIGTGAMKGVSCLSSSFCAVVDDSGNVHIATTEEHIEEFGGVGWAVTDVDGTTPLRGIACSSTSSCIAVDGSNKLLNLAVAPSGEATTSGQSLKGAGELTAVTCTGQTCAAVDDNGAVFASTNEGVDWFMRHGGGSGLTSVSCASASLCAAVTKTGDATTFNPANTSAPLTITNTSLPAGSAGAPYEAEVQASGGEGPYQWSATGLPPGLSIDEVTGRITGTPSTAICVTSPCPQPPATYTPTITVADTGGAQAEASFEFAIAGMTHAIKVTTSGAGAGGVGSSPAGIEECGTPGGTCEALFLDGTVVTLTAHPAPGSRFAGWSGGGCSGTGTCQLTIGPDRSLTANFEKVKPLPANLRIGRVRIAGLRCALRSHRGCARLSISVRGTIVEAARGIVIIKAGEQLHGRRVTATKRAPISHGHWHARLRLPSAGDIRTSIRITARFAGSSGVLSGYAQRHLGKVLPLK